MSDEPLERDAPALAGMYDKQIGWALSVQGIKELKPLTDRDKLVLLALVKRANRVNGYCYRSLAQLAEDLGKPPSTYQTSVSKSLRKLKDHKLIDIEQRGKQLKNFYAIRWPGYDE